MQPPCPHGKRAVCRWTDRNGRGCRWGDACYFCHECEKVTPFSKIQKALANRRLGLPPSSTEEREPGRVGIGLLGLLDVCPALLLEGPLGTCLHRLLLARLSSVSRAMRDLITSPSAAPFWRSQLRGLRGLTVIDGVLNALPPAEAAKAACVLGSVSFKGHWTMDSAEDLDRSVHHVQEAKAVALPGARLFAYTFCYSRMVQNTEDEDEDEGSELVPALFYEDSDLDSDGTRVLTQQFIPEIHGDWIMLPTGLKFRVEPIITSRQMADGDRKFALELRLAGDETGPDHVCLPHGSRIEAWLWLFASRSQHTGLFIGHLDKQALTMREASDLLSWRPEGPEEGVRALVVARCVRRFWEIELT